MARLHLVGQAAACLGYDFKTALNQPLLSPVRLKRLYCHPRQFGTDQINRLNHIDKTHDRRR
jgi:hypothetical protein